MIVVLDTNVLISAAILADSIPGQALDACMVEAHTFVMSPQTLAELIRVLGYVRVRSRVRLSDRQLEAYLERLRRSSLWVEEVPEVTPLLSDPKDTIFVAQAVAAGADVIVSGDADLLDLGVYAGIPIMTAREFVEGWWTNDEHF